MEWRFLVAALKCGRQPLADHFLQTSQTDVSKKLVHIQNWWRRAAAARCENRVVAMSSVLNRLSNVFSERFPFDEEQSDGESTCFLGDDSDCESSDADSYCNDELL